MEATRPAYVRCKQREKTGDRVGQPAYYKQNCQQYNFIHLFCEACSGVKLLHRSMKDVNKCPNEGRVEKTDSRSADYPLTPTPRTTSRITLRTTLRTTPRTTPRTTLNNQTNLLLRWKERQEDYLLRLHDHNCIKLAAGCISCINKVSLTLQWYSVLPDPSNTSSCFKEIVRICYQEKPLNPQWSVLRPV